VRPTADPYACLERCKLSEPQQLEGLGSGGDQSHGAAAGRPRGRAAAPSALRPTQKKRRCEGMDHLVGHDLLRIVGSPLMLERIRAPVRQWKCVDVEFVP